MSTGSPTRTEQTKFEGERLARAAGESLPVSIFAPA